MSSSAPLLGKTFCLTGAQCVPARGTWCFGEWAWGAARLGLLCAAKL